LTVRTAVAHYKVLLVERQEERLKTNNRDLSMASDAFKCVFSCCS